MSEYDAFEVIQLVRCIPPTDEQRNDPDYIPQLEINSVARDLLIERFQSPISIVVYAGSVGAGKSRLASLTTAQLLNRTIDPDAPPFKSGDDPKGITRGIWMTTRPLKIPSKKRGSILILDCEGMGGLNVNTNNNLYLFCLIVSSVLALVLRNGRIEREQYFRLYDELCRFQEMRSPCLLPSTWLVPLELPVLKCNDEPASAEDWIEKTFAVDDVAENLTRTQQQELRQKYQFIRKMLPNIDVANLKYLPITLKDNTLTLQAMRDVLTDDSSREYRQSLEAMLAKFLNVQGKRLPGCNSTPALMVRPAELALFMGDLIDVINRARQPNPDELISRCLLKRFQDDIVEKKVAEFERAFLNDVAKYAKEKIGQRDTHFEPDVCKQILREKREVLTEEYMQKLKKMAAEQIYGVTSQLLSSSDLQLCLETTRKRLTDYNDPEELLNKVRAIYAGIDNRQDQEEEQQMLSEATDRQLRTIADRICREEIISQAIAGPELQCEVDKCHNCGRIAGTISVVHRCSSKQKGNFYRYDETRMVCDACRSLTKIMVHEISCALCGSSRTVIKLVN